MTHPLPLAIPEEPLTIETADGVLLEARSYFFAGALGRAVVCHPHPLQGGTMDNKVVSTSVRAVAAAGLATLRFNFRGVGASTGSYAGGIGEVADVRAALLHADRLVPDGRRALLGFSFGSAVSARTVAKGAAVDSMVLIGPPLTFIDFPRFEAPGEGLTVIVGDRDEFCPLDRAREFVASFDDPLVQLQVIPDADHFFHARLPQLARAIEDAVGS